jgi:hypothetical protein
MKSSLGSPKLVALCTWEEYLADLSQDVLDCKGRAPLSVVQQSPLTQRAAGLYLMKFFAELDLHSTDEITGKIVWFSASKAREVLTRRKLGGKFGVRC